MTRILLICLWVLLGIIGFIAAWWVLLFLAAFFVDPARDYSTDSAFYRFLYDFSALCAMFFIGIRIRTTGTEKIPKDCKVVFVSNHRSNFDPIVQMVVMRRQKLAFISKEANFHIPAFGRIIRKMGFLSIDRNDPRQSLQVMFKAADRLKSGQFSIGVYPEGTRSKTLELLPFHDGVFKIAKRAEAPVVVGTITGTEQIRSNFPFHRSTVYFDVIETIPVDYINENSTHDISRRVRADIEQGLTAREQAV